MAFILQKKFRLVQVPPQQITNTYCWEEPGVPGYWYEQTSIVYEQVCISLGDGRTENASSESLGGRFCWLEAVDEVTTLVYVPPVPAQHYCEVITIDIPARLELRAAEAWDGAAYGLEALTGDGDFGFFADPLVVGAVVGLTELGLQGPATYYNIRWGFYLTNGTYRVFERGVSKTGAVPYAYDTEFVIRRTGSEIQYLVNNVVVYTSLAAVPTRANRLIADASLYYSGDTIRNSYYDPAVATVFYSNVDVQVPGDYTGFAVGHEGATLLPVNYVEAEYPLRPTVEASTTVEHSSVDVQYPNPYGVFALGAGVGQYAAVDAVYAGPYQIIADGRISDLEDAGVIPVEVTPGLGSVDVVVPLFAITTAVGKVGILANVDVQYPNPFASFALDAALAAANYSEVIGSYDLNPEVFAYDAPVRTTSLDKTIPFITFEAEIVDPLLSPITDGGPSPFPPGETATSFYGIDGEPTDGQIEGILPPVIIEIEEALYLAGVLPAPIGVIAADNQVAELTGILPWPIGNAEVAGLGLVAVDGVLPWPLSEIHEAPRIEGVLPWALGTIVVDFPTASQVLEGVLPLPIGFGEIIGRLDGVVTLEGVLSWPETVYVDVSIEGILPTLFVEGYIPFDSPVESVGAYVVNTNTGAISEYTGFGFSAIRNLAGKNYAIGGGKLYRVNDRKQATEFAPIRVLTHIDNRTFNQVGELVPSQNMKRMYGAYAQVRTNADFKILVQRGEDHVDEYIYPGPRPTLKSIRVDTWRGLTAMFWGYGIESMDTEAIDVEGFQVNIHELQRRIRES